MRRKNRRCTVITFSWVLMKCWRTTVIEISCVRFFQYNLTIMPAFDAVSARNISDCNVFLRQGVRSVFYDRIDYPRACTWGTWATYVCQTSEQSKVFHGLELTDRFSYGPLLLQPRATMQRRPFRSNTIGREHRQVARSRRDKEPRVLPIRTSDTAV